MSLQRSSVTISILILMLSTMATAQAGDVAAGKIKVEQQCAECHRASDWDGETNAALESLLKDIMAGKVPHRKRALQLSEQDIADIAAYWTSGRKK